MKALGKSVFLKMAAALVFVLTCQAPHAQPGNCFYPVGIEALEACAASLQADDTSRLVRFGDIYFKGEAPALKPDKPRGIAFYMRAAQAGDCNAQLALANALDETGAPPDQWLKWVEMPALLGDDRALSRLQNLSDQRMAKDQPLREQYLKTLSKVLDQGRLTDPWYWTLAGLMGTLYEHGLAGVSQNSQEAIRWYLRAADRGGIKSLSSAMSIYKLGTGLPQDHKRAEQLLDLTFRQQSSFFKEHPEFYVEALYDAADLGFSSAAHRLVDIHAKGLFGVKADPAAAERWKKYAQAARYAEKNGVPEPAVRARAKPDAADAQCESDAKAFVEQEFRNKHVNHAAHFNRIMGLCLADITLKASPAAVAYIGLGSPDEPLRAVIDVHGRRELAHYMPGKSKQVPIGCRTQMLRLRASYEMQQSGCDSLAEYEAFVDRFMND